MSLLRGKHQAHHAGPNQAPSPREFELDCFGKNQQSWWFVGSRDCCGDTDGKPKLHINAERAQRHTLRVIVVFLVSSFVPRVRSVLIFLTMKEGNHQPSTEKFTNSTGVYFRIARSKSLLSRVGVDRDCFLWSYVLYFARLVWAVFLTRGIYDTSIHYTPSS